MSKLVFSMDELKKISKSNLIKVYKYYFPDKSTSKLRKDQLASAIYREANKEFFDSFLDSQGDKGTPRSVRIQRIHNQNK